MSNPTKNKKIFKKHLKSDPKLNKKQLNKNKVIRIRKSSKKKEIFLGINVHSLMKWILLFFAGMAILSMFTSPFPTEEEPISTIVRDIKEDKIEKIDVAGESIEVKYKNQDKIVKSRKEPFESFTYILNSADISLDTINVKIKDQTSSKFFANGIELLVPILLTGFIIFFIFKQMRGAQDSVFSFGKNKAKIFIKGKQDVKFSDVGGVDEVKQELEEIVDFLKHPQKYQKLGAKTPNGVLLVGPAGTGKTLLARAVAGEADVPYFSMAGSEFMEMLVGVGASRVRDLFNTAKKQSPSIIFIDEIDAIGRQRGMGTSGGHDEREQTLNQILVEMDGFTPRDNVIVIAATNRGDLLDPALLRPGRFDRRVVLDLPDMEGRKHILKIHSKKKPFVKDLNWNKVAKRTVGFSGADLESVLNEAAISAARNSKAQITYDNIEEAATKIKLGPRKKRLQSDKDKLMTAYHEAGHALCAYYLENTDSVHRVSIISRGRALGYTQIPPERDKYHETKSEMLDQSVMLLGGRAAEEIQFSEITGGAASDIERVTMVVRRMVTDYGMSKLGPINLNPQIDRSKWSSAYYSESQLSEKMQAKVDSEIKKIVDKSYQRAIKILNKHKDKLDLIAKELIKVETLESEDFERLMKM